MGPDSPRSHQQTPVEEVPSGLLGYWVCLKDNPGFRALWFADVVDNIGGWLTFVAILTMVEDFSHGSGLALSAVVLIRFLPSLLLCPIAGAVADRCNRVRVMVWTSVLDAVAVAALALVRRPSQVPLLYTLLALQFGLVSFFDPARKAIVPVLVPPAHLHLATTLDTFAWSITGAVGAAVGGALVSRLGPAACFLLDSLTYLVAAWLASKVPLEKGWPAAPVAKGPGGSSLARDDSAVELELSAAGAFGSATLAAAEGFGSTTFAVVEESRPGPAVHGAADGTAKQLPPRRSTAFEAAEDSALLSAADGGKGARGPAAAGGGSSGWAAMAVEATLDGLRSMREGWAYMTAPANRDVALLVLVKGSAALTWGGVDIINVRYAEMPSMQSLGDSSFTLGIIFAVVGGGCFLGPLVLNPFVPPRPQALLWGNVASFACTFVGFLLMTLAPTIWLVLLSTFIRAVGSACLWIYSTLLLQLRVPNAVLGRISAIDIAIYTVGESASSLLSGAALDLLRMDVQGLAGVLTGVAAANLAAWTLHALASRRRGAGYSLVGGAPPQHPAD